MGNIFLHVACITTHLKHCHATKFRCCKLKQHVASSWTGVYFFQQIFSTCSNKFCCVTMFVVGGNTCNNAFQLAMQHCCVASCSNLLLVLLHLKSFVGYKVSNSFSLAYSSKQQMFYFRYWRGKFVGNKNYFLQLFLHLILGILCAKCM